MVRGIDPYPVDVPVLDPGELKSHVMRTANSAPGEDAYPLTLLQAMPLPAWQLLTKMFTAIENGGQWPTQLRSALVCAIPRADSGSVASPLKWRLISVTSHLYRAWGGLRARQIGKIWLAKISPEGLFGGVPKKSAEDAAHTSSFWWDQASVMNIPLWSISMDASKCFDSIAPASIIEIATRLGAPRKPLLALASWYVTHDRRLLVKDWIQEKWTPPKGILQGCPMSVLLCATWGLVWSKHVGRLLESPRVAVKGTTAYLDDLSISSSDKGLLTVAAGWTMVFFRTWSIGVNLDKSVILQNVQADQHAPLTVDIRGRQDDHQLLGMPAGYKVDERIVSARVQKAILRLNRIETLPVGQKHLSRLTQTYVLPLVYACEYVPYLPICYDLDKRIKDLVWGKARVSANMYAAKAYALPAHNLFIEGQRVIRCFRAVWRMANRNVPRQHYMTLWLAPQVARREGAWYQFLGMLEEWGACLRDDGGIEVAWKQVVLHLNQDYRSWMHNTRLALRLWNLGRARGQNPRTYDMDGG